MAIDPLHSSNVRNVRGSSAPTAARPSAPAPVAPSSSHATHLNAVGAGDQSQDIDAARVAAVRQGLADGTLRFDTSRIADAIIASARELAGTPESP